ncbi:hypothetical protein [Pedosphaera parvula]|uniref:Uncharacterized protein n=1 Tax=Pedosphaera parvula (strain Ellin514) TaxID=320771 RepID=B9XHX3_PEDPL|nr:hypothetical protein [Pedosphaera parvula]EEF60466.1 hypothetical protein Cflav_PD3436 [Pedosphaera parvula Ellin514]
MTPQPHKSPEPTIIAVAAGSILILVMVVTLLSMSLSKAQSNAPPSIILPAADWNVREHVLASLVTTNKPGDYPLPSAWAGVEKVTARTGWHARKDEVAGQTNRWFHFDKLTVCPGPIFPVMREDRYIWDAATGRRSGPAYRPSLPTDSELLGMHDDASVTNFLGFNPFRSGISGAPGIRYFTLGPYNTIKTLNVTFMKGTGSNINSILIRRGTFQSEERLK